MSESPPRAWWKPALAAVLAVVAVVVGLLWVNRQPATTGSPRAEPSASTSVAASPGPLHVQPSTTLAGRPGCGPARHPFPPVSISIPGVTRGASVVRPPRDANNIPGTPLKERCQGSVTATCC